MRRQNQSRVHDTIRMIVGVCTTLAYGTLLASEPADVAIAARDAGFRLAEPSETAAEIDRMLREEFPAAEIAHPADDYAFLRRVCLDLVGALPTPEEITAFALDPSPHKRSQLVQDLLDDPRYGVNWGRYWRDVIYYRRAEDRAMMGAEVTEKFLAEQLNTNQPWNEIASAFVTAAGDVREHGETAIIAAQTARPEETVAEISRIFMGIQIQCAQCHDHPFDSWEREQFHELAAFFPRVGMRALRDSKPRSFEVIAVDSKRSRRQNPNRHIPTPEHYMSDLDDPTAKGTLMTPTFFVSGQSLELGTKDADRREALARWITSPDNEWFAKALVNRIWSELMGVGFYEPVDDIGPEREASAEPALDHLANAFTESGYDLKWLFRTVTSTEAYGRSSISRSETGDPQTFLTTNPQRMRSDQLFNALTYALFISEEQIEKQGRKLASAPRRGKRNPRMLFSAVFGYDPSRLRSEVSGSVPQALMLMNSPIVNRLLSARRVDGLGGMLRDHADDRELISELYLRCFSRPPTRAEMGKAMTHLKSSQDRASGFEDILWALVNSAEFIYRT